MRTKGRFQIVNQITAILLAQPQPQKDIPTSNRRVLSVIFHLIVVRKKRKNTEHRPAANTSFSDVFGPNSNDVCPFGFVPNTYCYCLQCTARLKTLVRRVCSIVSCKQSPEYIGSFYLISYVMYEQQVINFLVDVFNVHCQMV